MTDEVLVDIDPDGVATVTLNRAEVGNAISVQLANELCSVVDLLKADSRVRVVLLRGAGANFCVGGDVAQMAAASHRGAFLGELAGRINEALSVLREVPIPIVSVVRGAAAGAGLGIVLASDIVIADRSAKFLTAYAGVGLTPDCGVSALLPAVVGVRRAAILALVGKALPADEALEWGLVSEVCPAGDADARAAEVCSTIAAGPAAALGEAAVLLRAGATAQYHLQLEAEAATIARIADTPDAGQRIARFITRNHRKDGNP